MESWKMKRADAERGARPRRTGVLAACLLAAAAVTAAAADWTMFRGNAARTGFVAEQAAPPLTKAWEFQAGGGIISSPVIWRGAVYFGAADGKVYAFDAVTGAQLWQYRAGGRVDASPAAAGGAVYAVSTDGYLHALDRLTGALLWKTPLGAFSISSPLVLDGRVYVGTGAPERKLKVFDAASGAPAGERQAAQPVDSAPSSDGSRIYFGANDGRLYALEKSGLSPVWAYQTTGGRYGLNAAAVAGGIVYAVPGYDETKPLALDAASGALLNLLNGPFEEGVLQTDGSIAWAQTGSPVVSADRLYFSGGSAANRLYAAKAVPESQALPYVWTSTPSLDGVSPAGVLSSPAMADELIYAGTVSGELVAFTSSAASVPLTADVNFSSPVYSSPGIANGMVFAAGAGGRFAAYRAARAAAFSSPEPGAVVSGQVSVLGYVVNPALAGYELAYSSGGAPEVWHAVRSSATVHAVAGGALAQWDTSALPNGNYTLRLTVLETGTPAYDNTARLALRVNAAPSPPSALTAQDAPGDAGNRIYLAWTPSPTPDLAAYRIYRGVPGGALSLLASAAGGASSYTDASAVTGSTFTYAVRAWDGYAESADSNIVSARSVNNTGDFTPPAAVTDLTAEPSARAGAVTLTWTAPGNDGDLGQAAYYLIRYSTWAGYDWNTFDSGGLPVSTRPAEGPAGDNISAEISGLLGGVTYYFALKAADFVPNLGGVSNAATAYATPDYYPPAPPSGLAVADTPGDAGGRLTLSWTLSADDTAGGVYGYRIWRRSQQGTYGGVPYAETGPGAASYTDQAAAEGIRFYYSVSAFDSTNDSGLSNEAYGVSADNWRFFDAAQGGSLRLPDGARVDIPGNAVSQNDSILVTRLDAATYQPLFRLKAAGTANPTGVVYEVKFLNPATVLVGRARITLPYTDSDVAGMNAENLRIYTLSGGNWQMLNTSSVDAAARTVSAEVGHFSIFRIMEYVPSGELLPGGEVYTYPNPAPGDTVTFKFRPADKAYVKIDVYNVAGEKVAALERAGCPAGVASEIVWNVRNIASGVYVYQLKAETASGSRTVTKKLAIAH